MNAVDEYPVSQGLLYDSNGNDASPVHTKFECADIEPCIESDDSTGSIDPLSIDSIDINRSTSTVNYYHEYAPPLFYNRCFYQAKKFYIKLGFKHILPLLLLTFYSVIGAGAFYSLESSNELENLMKNRRIIKEARRQMIERIWELKLENLTRRKVFYYANEALNWYDEMTKNLNESEQQWDFWGAIFYCGTIYTTIGYGNIVPKTFGGKLLTMFYAAFGIPLVFFILNDLGDVLGRVIYKVWTKLKKLINFGGKRSKLEETGSVGMGSMATTVELTSVHDLPMSVALGITLGWMFLCSAVFCSWENWDYFQSFHFFFVSLTTVGLGDTVPVHHQYMIMSFGLILLGLSLVSMCIQVAQAKVEHLAQQILEKLMKRYETGEMDEHGDLIDRTLDQTMAPSWLKALLTRKNRAKLMKELKRRTKMRVKGTQTDFYQGRRISNATCQTEAEPNWKGVYERKLSAAQDLLKQLEHRYNAVVREKEKEKHKQNQNSARNSICRIPSKRISSFKEKLSFRIPKRLVTSRSATQVAMMAQPVSSGTEENENGNSMPDKNRSQENIDKFDEGRERQKLTCDVILDSTVPALVNHISISTCSCTQTEPELAWVEMKEEQCNKFSPMADTHSIGLQSENWVPQGRTVVVVEEDVEESMKNENRSRINRWIRRFVPNGIPKKSPSENASVACQTDQTPLNEKSGHIEKFEPALNQPEMENKSTQCSISSRSVQTSMESDLLLDESGDSQFEKGPMSCSWYSQETQTSEMASANTGVQCGGYPSTRFLHVPYVLDDCKLLFKAIQKRLSECQSILTEQVDQNL